MKEAKVDCLASRVRIENKKRQIWVSLTLNMPIIAKYDAKVHFIDEVDWIYCMFI